MWSAADDSCTMSVDQSSKVLQLMIMLMPSKNKKNRKMQTSRLLGIFSSVVPLLVVTVQSASLTDTLTQ